MFLRVCAFRVGACGTCLQIKLLGRSKEEEGNGMKRVFIFAFDQVVEVGTTERQIVKVNINIFGNRVVAQLVE